MVGLLLFAFSIIPAPVSVYRNGGEAPSSPFAPLDVPIRQVADTTIAPEGYVGVLVRRSQGAIGGSCKVSFLVILRKSGGKGVTHLRFLPVL